MVYWSMVAGRPATDNLTPNRNPLSCSNNTASIKVDFLTGYSGLSRNPRRPSCQESIKTKIRMLVKLNMNRYVEDTLICPYWAV